MLSIASSTSFLGYRKKMIRLTANAEVVKRIDALRRAFLWAGYDKVTRRKCKINWFEWASPAKPWLGLGTPCDDVERNLFAAATTVKVGSGNKACF